MRVQVIVNIYIHVTILCIHIYTYITPHYVAVDAFVIVEQEITTMYLIHRRVDEALEIPKM